ncbi:DUF1127 domain-containing protein [Acuticoccus sp. MNP-M23]|uniref:DUF1127 domain-containing protein n=1 Tax=Acuticoccus sp. MNP-M23 TaxID=3072793 RepID=UPI002816303C|nr:DUF1127 domain-containing protein [Acuticoccus sp. MNP-M23]WMS40816.1 DUF1127 domain-containing protein [Acuticoccus sp. MNP-M23]
MNTRLNVATLPTGLAGWSLSSLRERYEVARQRRMVRNQCFNELAQLNDRELAELGFFRCDIARIADEHAFSVVPRIR